MVFKNLLKMCYLDNENRKTISLVAKLRYDSKCTSVCWERYKGDGIFSAAI